MSRANKHRSNRIESLSLIYMKTELGSYNPCPRRACSGIMIEVWSRYTNRGTINKEQECCVCGKVIKDPRFREEREKHWKEKKKAWDNRQKKNRGSNASR